MKEKIDWDYFSIGGEIERGFSVDEFDCFDDDGTPIPKKFFNPEKYEKYIQKKQKNMLRIAKAEKKKKIEKIKNIINSGCGGVL